MMVNLYIKNIQISYFIATERLAKYSVVCETLIVKYTKIIKPLVERTLYDLIFLTFLNSAKEKAVFIRKSEILEYSDGS